MISNFIDLVIRQRFLVLMSTILLVAVGVWAMGMLPIDAVPDVTNTQVQVMTTAPALAPEEIEQFITFPVETSMSGMPRVAEIRSVSQFGLSVVTIVFEEGTDIYWARQLVGERLQRARESIPDGMASPELGPIATGLGEIYQFAVRSAPGFNHSLMELREILDWQIAYQLRSVPGVIDVNVNGGEVRAYQIQIDPQRLQDHGIPIARVFEALRQNNANEGGGYLILHSQEQRVVRGEGLVHSLEDIGNIVLETSTDGTPVTLGRVAEIAFSPLLRQGAVTRDGKGEGVVGVVMLLAGENSRTVVERVKEKVAEIERTLPEGVVIDVFYDRTELVRRTVHTFVRNLIEGGVLVVLILLVLLGSLRAGLIVALAVPLSMLGAFIGMFYAGLSGNLMSLGAIDFGLIVDGSVVMVENVVRRVAAHRHQTLETSAPLAVVRDACVEVARPVIFGVGIILLVYLPILSLRGIEGKMFRPMALTVIFAMLTSLLLALTIMPALSSLLLRSVSEKEPRVIRGIKRLYETILPWAMAHRAATLSAAALAFILSFGVAANLGAVFIPKLDEGAVAIQAIRLPSVSLESSVEMTMKIEQCLLEFPEVRSVISKTGRPEIANDPMTVNLTDIIIDLEPPGTWRFASKDELVSAMEEALQARVPANLYSFSQPIELRVAELVAGVKSDIGISLYGDDLDVLREKAGEIARVLSTIPGAADVQTEQTGGLPYLRILIDRSAISRYGIDARNVLDAISTIGGKQVGQVFERQRRFPIQVRLGSQWREDVSRLKQIKIADSRGRQVPMERLAEFRLEDGPAQISRDEIRRRTLIQCNVRGRDLAGFVAEAQQAINERISLPAGYNLKWGGQFKNLAEATGRLAIAVPIALFLIFILLHLSLGSMKLALLIFLNVPMAATGGIVALAVRGLPFSISAGVGFIALFGVAVLNGVVLVSYIQQLRRGGADPIEAARQGATTRLRPVVMTALVAMLGFIPMAISTGSGAEVQRPLATVVIGGLITSTLLTLFVLPAIYPWFDPVRSSQRDNARQNAGPSSP